ncbi:MULTISPECIES: hypothetical protein [Winogradskyella]|uniref:hypothetical protein n=1 Tax=Winogradskyella TaxID=286104 RepID=UPI0015CED4D7|nr:MULTISPECIES: hypothetical protein [Winogradskyella]QXP77944.1 hypothetical protein H0I32_12030 [Winogradskyella sp. HaHa_3_26]
MKTKLHFGILAVLLAFLGTFVEQYTVPNQQIVIQFSDKEISIENAESAIAEIQNNLQNIGVSHIQVGENNQGKLRITYHSDTDIEYIQHVLFNIEELSIGYSSSQEKPDHLPNSKFYKDYQIDISEIKTSSSTDWDFNVIQVLELNQKTDRLSYFKTNNSGFQNQNILYNFETEILEVNRKDLTAIIDIVSYIIPEVRAGPITS